jgi:hypothetical protein
LVHAIASCCAWGVLTSSRQAARLDQSAVARLLVPSVSLAACACPRSRPAGEPSPWPPHSPSPVLVPVPVPMSTMCRPRPPAEAPLAAATGVVGGPVLARDAHARSPHTPPRPICPHRAYTACPSLNPHAPAAAAGSIQGSTRTRTWRSIHTSPPPCPRRPRRQTGACAKHLTSIGLLRSAGIQERTCSALSRAARMSSAVCVCERGVTWGVRGRGGLDGGGGGCGLDSDPGWCRR